MRAVLGLRSHSGWAALVVLGAAGDELQVIDRRRIELVAEGDAAWAKQPYHAAESLEPEAARDVVKRGVASASRLAAREVRAAVRRTRSARHEIAACAVLVGDPMPNWSVDEILAVHFRMHRAEGALFQDVLAVAARKCGVALVAVPVKRLSEQARATFGLEAGRILERIASLGKSVGAPWGKDQKEAALAAAIALRGYRDERPEARASGRIAVFPRVRARRGRASR